METTFDYLRQFGPLLAERILETYPPLQSTKDPVAPGLAGLLRKPLPAQAVAISGTAKYLRKAKAARIVAECGAGKTFMALGTIHVLSERRPTTTLVMCPSHITHKWAREVLLTIPRARTFLIEDMRNGGDPAKPHGICELKLSKGKTVYEGKRLSPLRDAPAGPKRVEEAIHRPDLLYHRKRQSQTQLLLGPCLPPGQVRPEPGRDRQSGFRCGDPRLGDGQADSPRLFAKR